MKAILFMIAAVLFSFMMVSPAKAARQWDYEPVHERPPTCLTYFSVYLPQNYSKAVYRTLKSKGYKPHTEGKCDSGPGFCYGVPAYLEIRGTAGRLLNGETRVFMTVFHGQQRRVAGGEEHVAVGLYVNRSEEVSYDRQADYDRVFQMVRELPTCKQLKLQETRTDCESNDCYGDISYGH